MQVATFRKIDFTDATMQWVSGKSILSNNIVKNGVTFDIKEAQGKRKGSQNFDVVSPCVLLKPGLWPIPKNSIKYESNIFYKKCYNTEKLCWI